MYVCDYIRPNKKAYNILISKEIKPPTSQIKILNMGISKTDLPHI